MTIEKTLKILLPEYAKDIEETFDRVTDVEKLDLTAPQVWGSAYAAAIASRNSKVTKLFEKLAEDHLDDRHMDACKGAAALMGMNNIYWRFWYLVDDREYLDLPHELSQGFLKEHDVCEDDFECWALAVSVINACAGCNKVHSRKLLDLDFTKEQILCVVRIASVVHSIAVTLEAEGF